jgi:aldehyde dehydrogenase (NAD+)
MTMPNPDYSALVGRQREYFLSGCTRPASWRKAQLETLKAMFTENHDELCDALWKDLRRNVTDADLMDVTYNVKEADYALKHLDAWMAPERVHTPLVFEPGHVRVRRDPLGVTLIIGAWNEPFMLLFAPLVAAFAGGNTAVLKPSELAVACSAAAARLVPKYFDPRAVAVVEGAIPETTALLAQKWDLIFFTGSPPVGKIVHQAAAKNLTPCVLELGGKNPTVVHSTANLNVAAHRIAYGRYLNSGHICTAPDHVLVWPEVKEAFVRHLAETIREFYGDDPKLSPDYGRVINRRNFAASWGCSAAARRPSAARPTPTNATSRRPCWWMCRRTRRSCRKKYSARSCRCSKSIRSRRLSNGSITGLALSDYTCLPRTSVSPSASSTRPSRATQRSTTARSTR